MIKVINANPERIVHYYTGSGDLTKGQLAKLSSSTAVTATEGATTAVLLGIVLEDAVAGAICDLYPLSGTEFEIDIYQGSTVDTFADADVGCPFDFYVDSGDFLIDPNDEANPSMVLMSYDNTYKTATARIVKSLIYTG
jgi:hypothetical protein